MNNSVKILIVVLLLGVGAVIYPAISGHPVRISYQPSRAANNHVYPLKLSSNGRYLVDQHNTPYFVVGEDAWSLATQIPISDVDTYLSDRSARGFNSAWIAIIDNVNQTNAPNNYYGFKPFNGADFTNEDSHYWSHIDDVINHAANYGITLWLSTAFVGAMYQNSILNSSDATMTAYGQFLGNRYKNLPNIVWVVGGDADPNVSGLFTKLADLARGIKSVDPNHLVTFASTRWSVANDTSVPGGGYSSLDVWSPIPSWLDVNWVYKTGSTAIRGANENYSRTSFLPPLMGEDYYEGDSYSIAQRVSWGSYTGAQVRQEGWNEILSGTYTGRMFGSYAIVGFAPVGGDTNRWQNQLESVGSVAQSIMGNFFKTKKHWLLSPDTSHKVLTAGHQSGSTLAVTARASDGSSIVSYIPTQRQVRIDLTRISTTSATASWFNPRTAATTGIGTYNTTSQQSFVPPDNNDWVLVIDAAAAPQPPPPPSPLPLRPAPQPPPSPPSQKPIAW